MFNQPRPRISTTTCSMAYQKSVPVANAAAKAGAYPQWRPAKSPQERVGPGPLFLSTPPVQRRFNPICGFPQGFSQIRGPMWIPPRFPCLRVSAGSPQTTHFPLISNHLGHFFVLVAFDRRQFSTADFTLWKTSSSSVGNPFCPVKTPRSHTTFVVRGGDFSTGSGVRSAISTKDFGKSVDNES